MTEIEIEKLSEAIARKLQPKITEELHDELEDKVTGIVRSVLARALTLYGDALVSLAKDI